MDQIVLRQAAKDSGVANAEKAVDKALKAGVPVSVIIQWLIKNGPDIWAKIQELIDAWKISTTPKAP